MGRRYIYVNAEVEIDLDDYKEEIMDRLTNEDIENEYKDRGLNSQLTSFDKTMVNEMKMKFLLDNINNISLEQLESLIK